MTPGEIIAYPAVVSADLALDAATGDLELAAGRARLARGIECTAQLWGTHLTLFLGEWYQDLDLGTDYQNEILIKNPRGAVLRSIFTRRSLETPGISEVEQLRFTLSPQRELLVEASVVFDDGSSGVLQLDEQIGDG